MGILECPIIKVVFWEKKKKRANICSLTTLVGE
jgi:hypothetical protein